MINREASIVLPVGVDFRERGQQAPFSDDAEAKRRRLLNSILNGGSTGFTVNNKRRADAAAFIQSLPDNGD